MGHFYFDNLSDENKKYYLDLVEDLSSRQLRARFNVSLATIRLVGIDENGEYINVGSILNYVIYEHPELYYLNYLRFTQREIIDNSISLEDCYTDDSIYQDELDRIVSKVREDCKNKNDYEKIIYVHDYLSSKVFYDFEAYEGNDSSYQSFSLIGPLIFSRGVCQGICLAASYLFEKLDIESEVILCYINSTRHTCNLVSYKEGNTVKKMILDITQDCKYDGDNSRYFYFIKQGKKIFPLTYFGFGISLDDYRNVARSYYLENLSLEDQKLINSLDNNYYYREKLYFHNFTELGLYISKLIGRRKTIQFYFDNDNYDPSLIVKKCSKMLSSHKINCLLQSNKIINRYVFIGGDLNER